MKSWFIRGALALAIAPALASAQSGADNARPITVDEAVRLAVQNSPRHGRRPQRRAQRRGRRHVRQVAVPAEPLAELLGQQPGRDAVHPGRAGSASPACRGRTAAASSSSLTIFDGGAHWYNYKAAGANLDAAVASDVSQRYAVALERQDAVLRDSRRARAGSRGAPPARGSAAGAAGRVGQDAGRRRDARRLADRRARASAPRNSRSSTRRTRCSTRTPRSPGSWHRPSW